MICPGCNTDALEQAYAEDDVCEACVRRDYARECAKRYSSGKFEGRCPDCGRHAVLAIMMRLEEPYATDRVSCRDCIERRRIPDT